MGKFVDFTATDGVRHAVNVDHVVECRANPAYPNATHIFLITGKQIDVNDTFDLVIQSLTS